MIEPPTVYEINPPYDEIEAKIQDLSDSIDEKDREPTPNGDTVIQSILDDIQTDGKLEVHKFGVEHMKSLAKKEDMRELVSTIDSWTKKEWSEDEKNEFQEVLSAN